MGNQGQEAQQPCHAQQWCASICCGCPSQTRLDTVLDIEGPIKAEELWRGVPPRNLLSGFGRVIRIRPDTLPVAERAKLFRLSRQVDTFDIFISHVCGTSGFMKYITLVMDQIGWCAFVVALVASCGLFVLQACWHQLPRAVYFTRYDSMLGVFITASFWELLGGVTSAWLVYALGHLSCRRIYCFFDFASISQTRVDLKAAGISNIPAFIRASRELLVLWDENYFSRLWCVYELAVAQSVRGIPIRILPMHVYVLLALGQLCWFAAGMIYLLVTPWDFWGGHFGTLSAGIPVFALQAHAGCTFARLYRKLQEQFESFDVRGALISYESDRRSICVSIEELFGGSLDTFNHQVRTNLKAAVLHSLTGQRAMITYRGLLWQTLPAMPLMFSTFSSTLQLPLYHHVSHYLFGVTFGFCVLPTSSAAAMELGKRIAACTSMTGPMTAIGHAGVGILFASFLCGWYQLVWILPCWVSVGGMHEFGVQEWHSMFVAVPMNALACVAAVWTCRPQYHAAAA